MLIIAALPASVTIAAAVAALIGGVIVALLSPMLLRRLASTINARQSDTLPVFWGKLFVCEIIASLLLYSGLYSFHVLPSLPSVMKVVAVLVFAVVLTTLLSLMFARRSSPSSF